MKQTFRDYMVEAMLFEYSNEYLQLCMECAEAEIMDQYILNQMVMNESIDALGIDDSGQEICLTESFFAESVSEEDLIAFIESNEQKKENIFKRVWNWFKTIVQRFTHWLASATGALTTEQEAVQRVDELNQAFDELWEDEDKAKAEAEASKAELDNAMNEIGRLRNVYENVSNQLTKAGADLGNANSEIRNLKKNIDDLKDTSKDKDKRIKQLEDQRTKHQEYTKKLQGKNKDLEKSLEKEKGYNNNLRAKYGALVKEYDSLLIRFRRLEMEYKRSNAVFPINEIITYFNDFINICNLENISEEAVKSLYTKISDDINSDKVTKIKLTTSEMKKYTNSLNDIKNKIDTIKIDKKNINGEGYLNKTNALINKIVGNTMGAISTTNKAFTTMSAAMKNVTTSLNKKIN